MKIMITGIGGVGGYIASVLCANYTDVTLIARKKRKESIQQNGLVLHSDFFGEHVFHPAVTDTPATAGIQDIIFVCVKNYSLVSALEALRPCVDDHTIIVLILNGVDHLETAQTVFPHGRFVDTCIYITSAYNDDFSISQFGHFARIYVGSADEDAAQTAYDVLNHEGLTTRKTNDITKEIWNKYILNCAYNVITAYYECTIGDALDKPNGKKEFRQLIEEAYTIGKALGVQLDDTLVDTIYDRILKQEDKNVYSSLARDVMNGHQSELDTFSGYLVRTAQKLHIDIPFSQQCYQAISQRVQ